MWSARSLIEYSVVKILSSDGAMVMGWLGHLHGQVRRTLNTTRSRHGTDRIRLPAPGAGSYGHQAQTLNERWGSPRVLEACFLAFVSWNEQRALMLLGRGSSPLAFAELSMTLPLQLSQTSFAARPSQTVFRMGTHSCWSAGSPHHLSERLSKASAPLHHRFHGARISSSMSADVPRRSAAKKRSKENQEEHYWPWQLNP
ncbi:hypothetical protein B0J12DRAFT_328349 [Macrophomina phaseolina]|uniref:Uncharacterized protein n=1 Tax=Macrophomina phaseolina TaxID=35725 RepID=A0ABQ8FWC2_9PEZI|nr:hypothetical protein B0J12DRAFT_328349 [Macrophomina phaseolina]